MKLFASLEVMTADGDIFSIDTDLIESVEPIDVNPINGDTYLKKIRNWCNWNRTVDIDSVDFFVRGNYYYIVRLENDPELSTLYRNTFVEKYSFDAPGTLLSSCEFNHEDGIKFWNNGEKLYLQTTFEGYVSGAGSSQDIISFHEIDF